MDFCHRSVEENRLGLGLTARQGQMTTGACRLSQGLGLQHRFLEHPRDLCPSVVTP